MTDSFADKVITWQKQHGRHNLPWQIDRSPYRVWVSEVMLQQTQVATVIPYYQRFMKAFATIEQLAAADEERVLALWSGLGYYARARNLHAAAKHICQEWQGVFPTSIDDCVTLPGVGRSTAGAILSLSHNIAAPILDGNVIRVLTRHFGIRAAINRSATQRELWQLADSLLPKKNHATYTQGLMDLGADICSRTQAACDRCPLQSSCIAHQTACVDELPFKAKTKKRMPTRYTHMAIIQNKEGAIWLQKRPRTGIWGGLWCFPEYDDCDSLTTDLTTRRAVTQHIQRLEPLSHQFSHFKLIIQPVLIQLETTLQVGETNAAWYHADALSGIGLPRPVSQLLTQVCVNDKETSHV